VKELDPLSGDVYFALALVYANKLDQADKAIELYEKAIFFDPENIKAY
jgi:tetratricopeptide (TPR) repeat protein